MPPISLHKTRLTTFLNPFSYYILRKSKVKQEIYANFNLHYDGISLVMINKLISRDTARRASFDDTSLAPKIFNSISENNLSLGIIGSSSETILKAKHILEEKYKINIKAVSNGYYSDFNLPSIIENFKQCDVVITSLGTPLQEIFLLNLKNLGWEGAGYTCGGYFDQLSSANGKNYYPAIFDKLQLRWLYRLLKEPRRLWKRYLIQYPIGIAYFIYDRITKNPPFNSEYFR